VVEKDLFNRSPFSGVFGP